MAKMSVSGIVYTSAFGPRANHKVDPNDFHWGADFGPPKRGQTGVPLFAIFAGKVTRLRDQYGALGVRVGDRKTEAIEFWHMANWADSLGMFVSEGDYVGDMGTTGLSTGIHVHVEHWVKGKRIDPLPFINKQAKKSVAPGGGDTDAPEEDDVALTPDEKAALAWLWKNATGLEEIINRRGRIDDTFARTDDLHKRIGVIDGTKTVVDELWRRDVAGLSGKSTHVDVDALAARLRDGLGAEIATDLARRLANG